MFFNRILNRYSTCPQCGQAYQDRACGPTHALVFGEIEQREEQPLSLNPLGENCHCVERHTPSAFVPTQHHILPKSWGGQTVEENMIWICPNTHTAVHRLIDDYVRAGGDPGWDVREHFSQFQRTLAFAAWDRRPENPTITSIQLH